MKIRKYKKKGYTILEVILSITLLALLMVPIFGIITTSFKSNKRADIRQEGAVLGQNLLEEFKSYDDIADANLTLLDGTILTYDSTNNKYIGTSTASGNEVYNVEVEKERVDDFSSYSAGTNTAATRPDEDYICVLNLRTQVGVNQIKLGNTWVNINNNSKLLMDLWANSSDTDFIMRIQDYTDNEYHGLLGNIQVNNQDTIRRNRIKIVLEDNFSGINFPNSTIPIAVNTNISGITIDIVKKKTVQGKISVTGLGSNTSEFVLASIERPTTTSTVSIGNETFTARQNILSDNNTIAEGDMYNIKVVIKKQNEVIFKSEINSNLN